jgi:hypothetical protein
VVKKSHQWKVVANRAAEEGGLGHHIKDIVDRNGERIAERVSVPYAALISAAPEMLEALKVALASNEALHHLVTTPEERMTSVTAYSALIKAIAKAEGRK